MQENLLLPPEKKIILPPTFDHQQPERKPDPELDALEDEVAAAGGLAEGPVQKHGVCTGKRITGKGIEYPCGKRGLVWLPANLCAKCLERIMAERGLVNEGV